MVGGIERLKVVLEVTEALAEPECKDALRAQGIVDNREHALLGCRLEVDENIPATDQIDARERGILEEVVLGEDDTLADGSANLVMIAVAGEVFFKQVGWYVGRDGLGINPLPGDLGGATVKVGREEAARQIDLTTLAKHFLKQDADGVNLLASGAARHPEAERAPASRTHKLRQHIFAEVLEDFGIAKKTGYTDEHVLGEILTLGRVFFQEGDIFFEVGNVANAHAALDAAVHSLAFIGSEI